MSKAKKNLAPPVKTLHAMLGMKNNIENERQQFVNRVISDVFGPIQVRSEYIEVFGSICYHVGADYEKLLGADKLRTMNDCFAKAATPPLRELTKADFDKTLEVVVALYACYELHFLEPDKEMMREISRSVEVALRYSSVDLGIRWKDGMFYPRGAGEMDSKLVEEPLEWLRCYPTIRADFCKAVKAFATKRYDDVVGDCYNVVEGYARLLLSNEKTLRNNAEEMLRCMRLGAGWDVILKKHITMADEYKRHASNSKKDVAEHEAEAFLYLTGLLVRLAVRHCEAKCGRGHAA